MEYGEIRRANILYILLHRLLKKLLLAVIITIAQAQ